jgi:chemotaxis protein MotB
MSSGGHGGSWIVTYSDMITLLMACFIMIITFASREPEKYSVKKDSAFDGSGGTGAVGDLNEGRDRDTVIWREIPPLGRLGKKGSEMPPLYSDPSLRGTSDMLHHLEELSAGTLRDNYALCVPLSLLFEKKNTLSPSGVELLHAIAQRIRYLPYDVHFEVDDSQNIPQAVLLAEQFTHEEVVHPARLGVGIRQGLQPWHSSVWVVLARHP